MTRRQKEALGAFAGRDTGDGKAYLREAHRLLADLLRTGGLHRAEREELDGYLALFEQQPNETGLEFFRQKLEGDRA